MKTSRKILNGILRDFDKGSICFHDITWKTLPILLVIQPRYIYIEVEDGDLDRNLCGFNRQSGEYSFSYIECEKLSKIIRQIIIALDVQFHVKY